MSELVGGILVAGGATALVVLALIGGWSLLDGWSARRDARRRNQAHRIRIR